MTDRVSNLTVVLDKDYRDDDVKCIVDAILMIRGVATVTTNVVDTIEYTSRQRARIDLTNKIWDVLKS